MKVFILSIGTELTTGQTVDTNAAWLSAELTALGGVVVAHSTVGDEVEDIRSAIGQGLKKSDLVIATGGLGPTSDDLTREAIALAICEPLEENPEAVGQIEAFFLRSQREMPASNLRQAQIPRGCQVIRNEKGTAPGIRFDSENGQLFALPGVPGEMKAMFTQAVVPALGELTEGKCVRTEQIHCFGMSEARIGELLAGMMARGRNPLVVTSVLNANVTVRIQARATSRRAADQLLTTDASVIRDRLGLAVYGTGSDTLESVVGTLLRSTGLTIATAESCTGGLLAKRLTDVPGSSAYFHRGYVTYANSAKTVDLEVSADLIEANGSVSEPVARAMASGCRTKAGVDLALSITGIAGPAGGEPEGKPVGLIYIGLATPAGVTVKRLELGDHFNRCEIRDRSCSWALNLLRLHLLKVDTI